MSGKLYFLEVFFTKRTYPDFDTCMKLRINLISFVSGLKTKFSRSRRNIYDHIDEGKAWQGRRQKRIFSIMFTYIFNFGKVDSLAPLQKEASFIVCFWIKYSDIYTLNIFHFLYYLFIYVCTYY